MKEENALSLRMLIFCIIVIGTLVAAFTLAALRFFQEISRALVPLSAQAQDVQAYLAQVRGPLVPWIAGAGVLATLVLWLLLHFTARGAVKRVVVAPPQKAAVPKEKSKERDGGQEAVQMLSILQRQGRFIDFVQEDLTVYTDEEVGAAVRSVHQGCKEAISKHMELQSIMKEEEGAQVTIQPGFDARAIRLTGTVSGSPPFKGTLQHHGWRVVRVELPRRAGDQEPDWVLNPAEVEVNA